jgi:hypothetical protein
VPVVIRTSDRGYFKRCRQLWDFTSKIRQNYEPIQRYPAFDFGTAIHAGLQAYYEPSTWGDLKVQQANALEAFHKTYADLGIKIRLGALEFEETFDEEVALGIRMLEYYFTWAPERDKNFKPIFVEIEFEVSIPGLDLPYQGRIDLIVEVFDDEGNSLGYWIVDHKTAKAFQDTAWLWLDDQCSSYAWAMKQQLGLDIRGVMFNQLKKKPPDPPRELKNGGFSVNKQQDTTFELFRQTLIDAGINPRAYREFLLFLKQNPKEFCRRVEIRFSPRQMQVIEKRIIQEAREMSNPDVEIFPTPSPMNCNGCRFFGPCLQVNEGGIPSMDNYEKRSA